MSRAELLAEAKAWRDIAKAVDADIAVRGGSDFLCYRAKGYEHGDEMVARVQRHLHPEWTIAFAEDGESDEDEGSPTWHSDRNAARVLACLWFALECEDEAASLTPARRAVSGRDK